MQHGAEALCSPHHPALLLPYMHFLPVAVVLLCLEFYPILFEDEINKYFFLKHFLAI
jgi:hypothetical protein